MRFLEDDAAAAAAAPNANFTIFYIGEAYNLYKMHVKLDRCAFKLMEEIDISFSKLNKRLRQTKMSQN